MLSTLLGGGTQTRAWGMLISTPWPWIWKKRLVSP